MRPGAFVAWLGHMGLASVKVTSAGSGRAPAAGSIASASNAKPIIRPPNGEKPGRRGARRSASAVSAGPGAPSATTRPSSHRRTRVPSDTAASRCHTPGARRALPSMRVAVPASATVSAVSASSTPCPGVPTPPTIAVARGTSRTSTQPPSDQRAVPPTRQPPGASGNLRSIPGPPSGKSMLNGPKRGAAVAGAAHSSAPASIAQIARPPIARSRHRPPLRVRRRACLAYCYR